jgi:hypothetical protein
MPARIADLGLRVFPVFSGLAVRPQSFLKGRYPFRASELFRPPCFLIPLLGQATSGLERGAMKRRRRVKQIYPLEDRLSDEAKELRQRARRLPPGPERDKLLRRARHDEAAAHMTMWLLSPGSRPPI